MIQCNTQWVECKGCVQNDIGLNKDQEKWDIGKRNFVEVNDNNQDKLCSDEQLSLALIFYQ